MENFNPFRYLVSYLGEVAQHFSRIQRLAAVGAEVAERAAAEPHSLVNPETGEPAMGGVVDGTTRME